MSTAVARISSLVALVVGPLSLIVTNIAQWMLHPAGSNPTATAVAQQFPTAWLVIGLLAVLGPLVWLGGLPAVGALAAGRGAALVRLGAVLTGAGFAAAIGHLALFFGLYGAIAQASLPDAARTAVESAGEGEVIGNVLLVVFLVGYSLGPILLTIGLRIGRKVAIWVPIAAILTAGANLFGGPIAGVVQLVTLAVVWGAIVIAVVRAPIASR